MAAVDIGTVEWQNYDERTIARHLSLNQPVTCRVIIPFESKLNIMEEMFKKMPFTEETTFPADETSKARKDVWGEIEQMFQLQCSYPDMAGSISSRITTKQCPAPTIHMHVFGSCTKVYSFNEQKCSIGALEKANCIFLPPGMEYQVQTVANSNHIQFPSKDFTAVLNRAGIAKSNVPKLQKILKRSTQGVEITCDNLQHIIPTLGLDRGKPPVNADKLGAVLLNANYESDEKFYYLEFAAYFMMKDESLVKLAISAISKLKKLSLQQQSLSLQQQSLEFRTCIKTCIDNAYVQMWATVGKRVIYLDDTATAYVATIHAIEQDKFKIQKNGFHTSETTRLARLRPHHAGKVNNNNGKVRIREKRVKTCV